MAVKASSIYRLVTQRSYDPMMCASHSRLFSDRVHGKVYSDFPFTTDGPASASYGSVFNLEFSPSDDIALAVCANQAVVAYEPRTKGKIYAIPKAHDDCTNCVTFLDGVSFATCSDDKSIRLWDLRNTHSNTAVLRGHASWVKNIEYDPKSGYLFSIAFFDGVRYWDLKELGKYTGSSSDNLVFRIPNPVRMRISPDASKMFISSRLNVCLLIENFNGSTVHNTRKDVELLFKSPTEQKLLERLKVYSENKPSLYHMSGATAGTSRCYRAVMSATFHPSSSLLGLRHLDVKNETLRQELTTIFDVSDRGGEEYCPVHSIDRTQQNYMAYIDEYSSDDSLDYIKEISFSADGRVLASPHRTGARLLAIDSACTPMQLYLDERYHSVEKSLCSPDFTVAQTCTGHAGDVLTCKFAHHDVLLGTGCFKGQVCFHRPQL